MKTARIVIGSNFGDEGKGLMTDYFAGDAQAVFRFNGGAQAGHTVVTPEGQRHVFSHFGSGSFRDVPTFLGWDFVVNPMNFRAERLALMDNFGLAPRIYVDPRALVTTPWDVMLNQFAEAARGDDRHGSVGIGFGETIERCSNNYPTRVHNLGHLSSASLARIRQEWVPKRAAALGFTLTEEQRETVMNDKILYRFMEDADHFMSMVEQSIESQFLDMHERVVFEGAQGLMLDQDYGSFPHVTRSNTGLKNVIRILKGLETPPESLEAVYLSRTYLTRHGAGPMPGELPEKPYDGIVDPTNINNAWQGSLRFAPLDVDWTAAFINLDIETHKGSFPVIPKIGLTCCDQVPESFGVDELFRKLCSATGVQSGYMSFGPTRNDVVRKDK